MHSDSPTGLRPNYGCEAGDLEPWPHGGPAAAVELTFAGLNGDALRSMAQLTALMVKAPAGEFLGQAPLAPLDRGLLAHPAAQHGTPQRLGRQRLKLTLFDRREEPLHQGPGLEVAIAPLQINANRLG